MQCERRKKISPSKEISYIAVTCALLIGGQAVFSLIIGVEIVTLIMVCFSYVFGVRRGVILALSFSILRCVIYGFYPTALILYIVYYPLLSTLAGGLGHIKNSTFKDAPIPFALAVNLLLAGIAIACVLAYALDLIAVSRFVKITLNVMLWVISAMCALLLIAFDALFIAQKCFKRDTSIYLKLITVASVSALCTICFTLLDDVITPLFWGYSRLTALAYFYSSFTAMLPQTICTIVSVSTLFLPLTSVFKKFCNK